MARRRSRWSIELILLLWLSEVCTGFLLGSFALLALLTRCVAFEFTLALVPSNLILRFNYRWDEMQSFNQR